MKEKWILTLGKMKKGFYDQMMYFRLSSVYSDPPELPRMLLKTFIRLPERLKA
jgi:hypothetical protein